jgi:ubiquitin carboxyl-terminal hydrolase L3
MSGKSPKWYIEEHETFLQKGCPSGTNPHWLPLESNPDVLNAFVHRTGLPTAWEWCDVFGLDEELLAMVPRPCVAICLLFPSKNISRPRRQEYKSIALEGNGKLVADDTFYLWQIEAFGNACGSIAAVHSVAANYLQGTFELQPGPLKTFIDDCKGAHPGEIGVKLADAKDLHEVSETSAEGGATETPDREDDTDNHFIAFVKQGNDLYEMDGCIGYPINHGPTTEDKFLSDAVKVIKDEFISRDPENPHFSLLALCKTA